MVRSPRGGSRTKNWLITWNNPPFAILADNELSPDHAVDQMIVKWADEQLTAGAFKHLTWQLERGESGTLHLQGYVQFARRVRLSTVRRVFPGCHAEARRGTHEEAVEYCSKEDTRCEGCEPHYIGEPDTGGQGKRTDLDDVRRRLFYRRSHLAPCA